MRTSEVSHGRKYWIKTALATLVFPFSIVALGVLQWKVGVFWPVVVMIPSAAIFYGLWPSVIHPQHVLSAKSLFWHRVGAVVMLVLMTCVCWGLSRMVEAG